MYFDHIYSSHILLILFPIHPTLCHLKNKQKTIKYNFCCLSTFVWYVWYSSTHCKLTLPPPQLSVTSSCLPRGGTSCLPPLSKPGCGLTLVYAGLVCVILAIVSLGAQLACCVWKPLFPCNHPLLLITLFVLPSAVIPEPWDDVSFGGQGFHSFSLILCPLASCRFLC